MQTAFMFPGQGSQQVGMGRDLAENIQEVAELYDRARKILSYDLASICFTGPTEELDRTEVSQPAIFVTSCACLLALKLGKTSSELAGATPKACLGLSLGEYTALYAAGAIGFEDALELVQLRAQSMQAAAEIRKGAMVSIIGMTEKEVDKLCRSVLEEVTEDDSLPAVLTAVNFNCPGQIVISGTINASRLATYRAEEFGARQAVPLRVAGAFHTEIMAPAAKKLEDALNKSHFSMPSCMVVANVDAKVYDDTRQMTDKLLRQLVSAVRWQQSIELLLDQSFERFVEIGPGKVLTGLVKRITRARKQKVDLLNISGL